MGLGFRKLLTLFTRYRDLPGITDAQEHDPYPQEAPLTKLLQALFSRVGRDPAILGLSVEEVQDHHLGIKKHKHGHVPLSSWDFKTRTVTQLLSVSCGSHVLLSYARDTSACSCTASGAFVGQ